MHVLQDIAMGSVIYVIVEGKFGNFAEYFKVLYTIEEPFDGGITIYGENNGSLFLKHTDKYSYDMETKSMTFVYDDISVTIQKE